MKKPVKVVKRYVEVIVLFKEDGLMIPKIINWNDETKFKIDRVIDVRSAASRKAGGQGERYLCLINGGTHELYFEDPAWFVEEKVYE